MAFISQRRFAEADTDCWDIWYSWVLVCWFDRWHVLVASSSRPRLCRRPYAYTALSILQSAAHSANTYDTQRHDTQKLFSVHTAWASDVSYPFTHPTKCIQITHSSYTKYERYTHAESIRARACINCLISFVCLHRHYQTFTSHRSTSHTHTHTHTHGHASHPPLIIFYYYRFAVGVVYNSALRHRLRAHTLLRPQTPLCFLQTVYCVSWRRARAQNTKQ